LIYRALLKYGYSGFRLEIIECCELEVITEREQYYMDLLKPEYNILKQARSLKGFKHSEATIERMREIKINNKRIRTEEEKLKHVNSLLKGVYTSGAARRYGFWRN
jgi:group I intron endonuclease